MSVPTNREHHYNNLRDRYTNCTYVDGNLELTWLQNKTFDLSFLQYIREVTGYVLISHVDVPRIVLPSLQIIRGRSLFKLNVRDEEFSLMVTLSQMENLEAPALRGKCAVLFGSLFGSLTFATYFSPFIRYSGGQRRFLQQLQPLSHSDAELGRDSHRRRRQDHLRLQLYAAGAKL